MKLSKAKQILLDFYTNQGYSKQIAYTSVSSMCKYVPQKVIERAKKIEKRNTPLGRAMYGKV